MLKQITYAQQTLLITDEELIEIAAKNGLIITAENAWKAGMLALLRDTWVRGYNHDLLQVDKLDCKTE